MGKSELPPRPKLMKCGCAPHALRNLPDGSQEWVCFPHLFGAGLEDARTPMPEEDIPDLEGRRARCAYYGAPHRGWRAGKPLRALPRKDGSYRLTGRTYPVRQKIGRAGCTWHKGKTVMGVGHWTAPDEDSARRAGAAIPEEKDLCRSEEDSSFDLPFFKFCLDKDFDEYYCGCHGWD